MQLSKLVQVVQVLKVCSVREDNNIHMDSTKLFARQKMSYWSQFIKDCKASGLSVRAFCENAGVSENRYYYWQKKLRNEICESLFMGQLSDGNPSFISQGFAEVIVQDESEAAFISQNNSAHAAVVKNVSAADMTTSLSDADISTMPISKPPPNTSPIPAMAMLTPMPSEELSQKPSQIQIEISGIRISADNTYPVDKLTEMLKGLVRI